MVQLSSEDFKGTGILDMTDAPGEDKVFIHKAPSEMVKELSPEQCRNHPDRDEEPFAAGDPVFVRGQAASGDHTVYMRMVHQVLSPGVKDHHEADPGAEVLRIFSKIGKSLRG